MASPLDGVDGAAPTPSPQQSKTNHNTEHGLVLKMNTSSTGLDHELRELHDGREAAVAGITISNNRRQVIDVLTARKSSAVVVLQGLEQLVDLLGHRVVGVVREVGTRFVRRR